jgi:hypothetical protein
MRKIVRTVSIGLAAALFVAEIPSLTGRPSFGPPVLRAQEGGWKAEYDSVCSKTDIAMTLSGEELKALIARCDQLRPKIEAEEESTRKVYLRRLHMCRELYKYMLDSKGTNQ